MLLDQKTSNSNKIENVLEQVSSDCCVHWITAGDWSMHDLLIGLLYISGPASVYLSSYTFSEHPARIIADLKARKIITELHCLIDSRSDKRSGSALTLVRDCATRCKLVNTHAKITIVENEKIRIVVIGSANYTTHKRYEAGVIVSSGQVVDFHKNWMVNEFNK